MVKRQQEGQNKIISSSVRTLLKYYLQRADNELMNGINIPNHESAVGFADARDADPQSDYFYVVLRRFTENDCA